MALVPLGESQITIEKGGVEQATETVASDTTIEIFDYISNNGTATVSGPNDTLSGQGYYSSISNSITDQGSIGNLQPGNSYNSGYYSSGTVPDNTNVTLDQNPSINLSGGADVSNYIGIIIEIVGQPGGSGSHGGNGNASSGGNGAWTSLFIDLTNASQLTLYSYGGGSGGYDETTEPTGYGGTITYVADAGNGGTGYGIRRDGTTLVRVGGGGGGAASSQNVSAGGGGGGPGGSGGSASVNGDNGSGSGPGGNGSGGANTSGSDGGVTVYDNTNIDVLNQGTHSGSKSVGSNISYAFIEG